LLKSLPELCGEVLPGDFEKQILPLDYVQLNGQNVAKFIFEFLVWGIREAILMAAVFIKYFKDQVERQDPIRNYIQNVQAFPK